MGDSQRHTAFFRKVLKFLAWFAGVWAALLIILQIVLSSSILGKAVEKFASEYIDGDLKFEKVRVNMFRHFPYVGIVLENGSLTYPAERFDSLEVQGPQGLLLYHGCGETADTLASFSHFSAGIDAAALMGKKIHISHVIMEKPRIFAHSYDEGRANWDIIRLTGNRDSSETHIPHIGIGRISLTRHPHIVYTSSRDTLFSIIDVRQISLQGKLDSRRSHRNKMGLSFEEMTAAVRISADTLRLGMDKLHVHEHNDHMDISAEARAVLATKAFGRMDIPISVKGTASFPKDTIPMVVMKDFDAKIAEVPISFDLTMRRSDGEIGVNGSFNIRDCKAEKIIDSFIKNIIPEAGEIRTDASISLSGTCNGNIGGGSIPAVSAVLTVPKSTISHKDIRHEVFLSFDADFETNEENKINVCIEKAALDTYGLQLAAHIDVEDITGDDPLIKVDGHFKASADSLLTFLPNDSGITATGAVAADLKGSMKMSQIDIYNFGQANIAGKITSDRMLLKSPKDTIDVDVEGLSIILGPETRKSSRDSAEFRLLAITGNIDKADIFLKNALTIKTEGLELGAKNTVEALSDRGSKQVYPLGGHINAKQIAVADGYGMSLAMERTSNRFQMIPKKDSTEIPVLSLDSSNDRITVRDISNRIILSDTRIHLGAEMNSMKPRLRTRGQGTRVRANTPEWMAEEDFRKNDLDFTLDGAAADYFRKWNINGSLNVKTGILMTPVLPVRNIISGMSLNFNNNEVRIENARLLSGNSSLTAKGSLTGLRRALLGRGIYNLDMELSTDRMDAAEFLAALNTGAALDTDAEKMTVASDSEFLDMIVVDSLDTDNINALIVVPANLNANIRINAGNISFSDLLIDELRADIVMKERCTQIANAHAVTNMGQASFEGFYATRTKKDIKTGFNLNLSEVTSEKVIAMMPAIDTIMPLLESFKGLVDCELAATADLDTCMNVIPPSINGVIRIKGKNLTMSDNKVFRDLAQKLKFRNQKKATIDKMAVEGLIKDNTLEVFPFVLDIDRYTLALSGLQNLDMSYRYHASIIHSPMVFKIGVDIYGPDFDNMKFKIGKPKYRNTNVPVFTAVIDETRLNLAESIRNIFEKGVEIAVMENSQLEAIDNHKRRIGYVNAAEQEIEELTYEEQKQLEEAEARPQIDSTSISQTLETIINGNE